MERSKVKLANAQTFTEQLLKEGTQVDIAMMSKQIRSRLIGLKNEPLDKKALKPFKLAFVGNDGDPLKSRVQGFINHRDITIKGLRQPIKGNNEFKVKLNEKVKCTAIVSVTVTRNGKIVEDVDIVKESSHCWNVKYQISAEGEYEIGVSIDGVEAEGSPFKRIWCEQLAEGTTVVRGQDWKWDDQDEGDGNHGTVTGLGSNGWYQVQWKKGKQNSYRWGSENKYDLMIVSTEV